MSDYYKKYLKYKLKYLKVKNMIGGSNIIEVNENVNETEFEQHNAVINYGSAQISTFNLVNCLAIGGVFELDGHIGTFLTHESPTDFKEQERKLYKIKNILDNKKARIIQIIFFRTDKLESEVYLDLDGLTTTSIISSMLDYCRRLFGLEPKIHNYTCDTSNPLNMMCSKAIISPTQYNSSVIPLRISSEIPLRISSKIPLRISSEIPLRISSEIPLRISSKIDTRKIASSKETFNVEVLYNAAGDKIYKCPVCNNITGIRAPEEPNDTSLFVHTFDCPNKNKIPVEPVESPSTTPASNGTLKE